MKLFGRTSGYYLFWAGFIYFWVGMYLAFSGVAHTEYATMAFVLALSVPLWCPPVARHFNMEPLMFDLFKRKKSNVVNFPTPEVAKRMPAPEPEPKEQPAKTYYRLGLTDNNRVSFNMGYSEITMNAAGCQQLIDQLEFFKNQLIEDNND